MRRRLARGTSADRASRQAYRLVRLSNDAVIAGRVAVAEGWWARQVGLLGRRSLALGEGLWLCPCNGVHTIFMRFAIDVLFLDAELRVVRAYSRVPRNCILFPARGAHSVVELSAGCAAEAEVQKGDRLAFLAGAGQFRSP